MDLSKYAALFLAESREHLSSCNQYLLEWERDPAAAEPVAGLFRAIHTIKGMAATMGYDAVSGLAHGTENLLDAVRAGRVAVTPALVQLLFSAVDGITAAVGRAGAGLTAVAADDAALMAELDAAAASAGPAEAARPAAPEAERQVPASRLVSVVIRSDAQVRGGRAMLALRRVEPLGAVSDVRPGVAMFERDDFDGRFTFRLAGDAGASAIEAAIRGAGDIDRVTVSDGAAAAGDAAAGLRRQIRIDLARLDALMKHVGELVVARNRLVELASGRDDADLGGVADQVSRLVGDLQSEVLLARMSPVAEVFDRFPRVVRDLARELGKQARFESEGGEIELDRAVLDEIGDPLLHLIRNAVDHGLESPEERVARGKPAEGRVVASASRERNTVVIRVADDGRGIDRQRMLERGRRDGLIDPAVTTLTDDLLLRLLARPGFSTATAVSGVSGRGVGVDVAMTRARALGGTLSVTASEGTGLTFALRVPLTLAIVRALLTGVGEERYAVPIAYVAETVDFDLQRVTAVRDRQALVVRERAIPTVHLRDLVQASGEAPPRRPGIILEVGERKTALIVDRLLGQQDIVVEPFEAPRGMPTFFGGATILADGAPALILDAAALV
jgi:two-component system chemotaxis sensor kinase CheA